MTWRRLLVVAPVLCAAVVPTVDASAHNGVGAAFKGRAGHYIVYAYDGELLSDGRLDYKLVVLNGRTKNPVYDVHPVVTAKRPGDPTTTATLTTFGNIFFYNLPNPYPHDWDVHLQMTGALGKGSVDYRMHGAAPTTEAASITVTKSTSSSWPLVAGVAAAAVLATGAALYLLRRSGRRRHASPR